MPTWRRRAAITSRWRGTLVVLKPPAQVELHQAAPWPPRCQSVLPNAVNCKPGQQQRAEVWFLLCPQQCSQIEIILARQSWDLLMFLFFSLLVLPWCFNGKEYAPAVEKHGTMDPKAQPATAAACRVDAASPSLSFSLSCTQTHTHMPILSSLPLSLVSRALSTDPVTLFSKLRCRKGFVCELKIEIKKDRLHLKQILKIFSHIFTFLLLSRFPKHKAS